MTDSAMPDRRRARRFAPVLVLALIALAAWRTGLVGLATPQGLHSHAAMVRAVVSAHPALAASAFVAGYAVLVAACLPVAFVLTLVAGALFGLWGGASLTVAGGLIGALIAYSAARSAAGAQLAQAAGGQGRVARAAEALRGEAFPVILAARLFPFMPFMVINLAAGLACAPLRAYAAATVLGAIPSSLIYAGLGERFGAVLFSGRWPDASALRDPRVIAPLLGLAALSLAGAAMKHRLERRRS